MMMMMMRSNITGSTKLQKLDQATTSLLYFSADEDQETLSLSFFLLKLEDKLLLRGGIEPIKKHGWRGGEVTTLDGKFVEFTL